MRRAQVVTGSIFAVGLTLSAAAAPPAAAPSSAELDAATRARIEAALHKPAAASQPAAAPPATPARRNGAMVAAQNIAHGRPSPWTLEDAQRAAPSRFYVAPAPADPRPDGGAAQSAPPPLNASAPPNGTAPPPVLIVPPPMVAPIPPVAVLPSRVFNAIDMDQRAGRLLAKADQTLQNGLRELKDADYEAAALSFRLASELDQGDPVSRVHFAHAALGTGEYEAAGAALRRALELQDKLILMRFEHERYFSSPSEFERLVNRLSKLMDDEGGVADEHFLLGYFQQQRGKRSEAAASFQAAREAGIKDDSLAKLLELTATKRR